MAYVGGPGNCYWGVLFLKGQRLDGSTGRRVNRSNGSMGQRVTFTFTILYMIADDARLTPTHCKKHTAYDDTRLTPRRRKKCTASFARSTGKFPSFHKLWQCSRVSIRCSSAGEVSGFRPCSIYVWYLNVQNLMHQCHHHLISAPSGT